jgi:hypothetical protein
MDLGRSSRSRAQAENNRARTLEDHRSLVSKEPPGKLLTEADGVMRVEDEARAAY